MKTIIFFLFIITQTFALLQESFGQVTQEWVTRYEPITNDRAVATALDKNGNVYVAGYIPDSITTIKYSPAGVQIWVRNISNGNGLHKASDIVVDTAGNVYTTGWGSEDYITVKYNSSGVQQWVKIQTRSTDRAYDIALDNLGNIYVTGTSEAPGLTAVMSFKYDTNGNMLWQALYDDPNGTPYGYSLGIDDSSNVYIAGKTIKTSNSLSNFLVIKYNSSGIQQWVAEYDGPDNSNDNGQKIAVDRSGNVYVTGQSYDSVSDWDYATVKFNTNGVQQWVQRYNGEWGIGSDYPKDIMLDNSGNVFVTGHSQGSGTGFDYLTIKYSSEGVEKWVRRYNGPGNGYEVAYAVAVDSLGNVYVTGESWGNGTYTDYATLKYNSSGNLVWEIRYNGPLYTDVASDITVDNSGNVYVTGYSMATTALFDYCTIKYSQPPPPPVPAAPVLIAPLNGALLVATNPLLDWDSSTYAESYGIQVSTDSLFTSTVYDSSNIPITEFQIPNNGLNINTTYYWRVNASNEGGTSPWSNIFHFTTGATIISGNNEIPKEFRLYNNYPNPFNPITRIKFDIPKFSFVKLIVYDILGKENAMLVNEKLNAGSYEVDWPAPTGNGSGYPSGVYFYKLESGDFSSIRKMILLK